MAMQALQEEEVFLVDCTDFVDHAKSTMGTIEGEKVSVLKVKSSDPRIWKLANSQPRSLRCIHLDGDHKAEMVQDDLLLANALLNDEGIICVDDFFNSRYPSLTYAHCLFLEQHRNELQMFLGGFNRVTWSARSNCIAICMPYAINLGSSWPKLEFNYFNIYKIDSPGAINCLSIGGGGISMLLRTGRRP
jgi:hypothetical protein